VLAVYNASILAVGKLIDMLAQEVAALRVVAALPTA
jgi:hypothetical protein